MDSSYFCSVAWTLLLARFSHACKWKSPDIKQSFVLIFFIMLHIHIFSLLFEFEIKKKLHKKYHHHRISTTPSRIHSERILLVVILELIERSCFSFIGGDLPEVTQ